MHNAGVRPSVQRIAVLSHIANLRRHPTADEIYTDLVEGFFRQCRVRQYIILFMPLRPDGLSRSWR